MFTGKTIKVVKRAERNDSQATLPDERGSTAQSSPARKNRDAVTVVMGWVTELRRKKVEEAAGGIERLFRNVA